MIYRLNKNIFSRSILKSPSDKAFKRFAKKQTDLEQALVFEFFGMATFSKVFSSTVDLNNKHILAVSKKEFFSKKEEIKAYLIHLIEQGEDVGLVIDGADSNKNVKGRPIEYYYSKEEILEICEVNDYLKSKGMAEDIHFSEFFTLKKDSEFEESWSLEKVIKANSEIDKVVQFIKENNLSPYETMVYIHKYVTNRFSYSNKERRMGLERYKEDTRNIVYAFEFEEVCCCGFASLIKAIIDKLDNPNLKCEFATLTSIDRESGETDGHAYNVIHLKDEKYGINGSYREDACLDSKDENNDGTFTFCLQPLSELDGFKKFVFRKPFYSERLSSKVKSFGLLGMLFSGDAKRNLFRFYKVEKKSYWASKWGGNAKQIPVAMLKKAIGVVTRAENSSITEEEQLRFVSTSIEDSASLALRGLNRDANNSIMAEINNDVFDERTITLKAVVSSPKFLKEIDENFKNDKDFLFEAINKNLEVLEFVPQKLFDDGNFVDGLKNLNSLNDQEKLLKFINFNNHKFLKYSNLINNKEFMLEAVKINYRVLIYTNLNEDKDFVREVLTIEPNAFRVIPYELLNDVDFMIEFVKLDPEMFRGSSLLDNRKFMLEAIKISPKMLEWSGLKYKLDFLADAIEIIPNLLDNVDLDLSESEIKKIKIILNKRKNKGRSGSKKKNKKGDLEHGQNIDSNDSMGLSADKSSAHNEM